MGTLFVRESVTRSIRISVEVYKRESDSCCFEGGNREGTPDGIFDGSFDQVGTRTIFTARLRYDFNTTAVQGFLLESNDRMPARNVSKLGTHDHE